MAEKKEKVSVIYAEKFKKGAMVPVGEVQDVLTKCKNRTEIELRERGNMSDGSEYMVIKVLIKK
jgi:hypothetical protein